MARGIVRAGVYLPAFTDGRRRVRGPDEDDFTLAATALERAVGLGAGPANEAALLPVGFAVPPELPIFARLLGTSLRLDDASGRPGGLAAAIADASRRRGPAWVVVVASDRDRSAVGPPGEGAVAILFDDEGAVAAPEPDGATPAPGAAEGGLGAALAYLSSVRRDAVGARARPDPTLGRPVPGAPADDRPPPPSVSQGAFVPAPRYAESQPSRWRFVAERCAACGLRTFPARGRCPSCGAAEGLRRESLPTEGGQVVAATWIAPGGQPTEFDAQVEGSGPYGVVLAEIAPDARVTLMVADAGRDEIAVGCRVDTVLRRLYPIEGAWRYGRKAVPATAAGASAPIR